MEPERKYKVTNTKQKTSTFGIALTAALGPSGNIGHTRAKMHGNAEEIADDTVSPPSPQCDGVLKSVQVAPAWVIEQDMRDLEPTDHNYRAVYFNVSPYHRPWEHGGNMEVEHCLLMELDTKEDTRVRNTHSPARLSKGLRIRWAEA